MNYEEREAKWIKSFKEEYGTKKEYTLNLNSLTWIFGAGWAQGQIDTHQRCIETLSEKAFTERLAGIEHEQWVYWTSGLLNYMEKDGRLSPVVHDIFKRKWQDNWILYSDLDEETKEHDRKWAKFVQEAIQTKLKEAQP